jgi:hypothetical protein
MRRLLITILVLLSIHSAYGQDRKLRRVKELLVEKKNSEADEIIKELIDKYPTLPTVLYYSSLVDLQLNRSLDSIYQKMKFGNKNLTNLRYVNNNSDSAELGFTKEEFQRFKQQIEGLAFDRYYKNAKTTDSLQLFIAKFDVSNTQRGYIENRICDISARFALTSVDVSVLRDFINNHKNCVELKMVESRLLALNWQSAKKFNTYKSYEMFAQENPSSIFGDSIKMAIEILDWEKTQFNDSISSYESFILKYPSSKFNNIASDKIDTLRWLPISTSGTLSELHDFVTRYPQSQFNKQAKDSIVKLEWFSIALTNDIETVNRFLEKYPNSNYEIQALKRFDDLLWKSTNVAAVESLKVYLNGCKSCGFKDDAWEKLSLIEWEKIKGSQDTIVFTYFLSQFPKSTKVEKASKRKAELLEEIEYKVARKVHRFDPSDSFETEDYWIQKHGREMVKKYYDSDSNKVIEILGKRFVTMIDWGYLERTQSEFVEYEYCGFSKIVNSHIIFRGGINEGELIYVSNNGEVVSESDLLRTRIIPNNFQTAANDLDVNYLVDVVKVDQKLRWICVASAGEYWSGFAILNSQIGIAKFYQESETYNFIKYNQSLSEVNFVNFNQCAFSGEQYLSNGSFKTFNGFFNYNNGSKQWQVLKK